jgi:hypothetical protein
MASTKRPQPADIEIFLENDCDVYSEDKEEETEKGKTRRGTRTALITSSGARTMTTTSKLRVGCVILD